MNSLIGIISLLFRSFWILLLIGIVIAGIPELIIALIIMFVGWLVIILFSGLGNLFSDD